MSSSSTATAPPPDGDSPPSSSNPPPSSSPPPPASEKSPPPSSSDNSPPSKNLSPPPSWDGDDSSSSSPPPPSGGDDSSSSSPPPPPPSDSDGSAPPPPPPSSNDDSNSPPPPPLKRNSPHVPPPPPRSSSKTPPSSKALSPPPPPPHSSSVQNLSSPTPSGPSQETIIKIAIGASIGVGLILIMFIICCVCAAKKKKKRKQEGMHYYGPPKGGEYYNSSQQQHPSWHNPQTGDHVVKLPPPPNSMGMPSSGGWPAQPPPPPPMMSSGEMSSNFSGPRHPPLPPPSPNLALGFNKSTFSYDELATATNGFSQANLLGQGGFGYVHKGVFPNGKEVAVKSLKTGSGQGEREFQAEVEIISRVHHRHLVSLVGYCIVGEQRMLVYEFVPNKTLEYHLHGNGRPTMDFPSRLRIAMGSAKGLAYLHEDCHPRIIHRDIKAANILIDYNYEAMVADFGLAKLSSDNYTHVSTRIMGTFGYLAPEYAASGKLTDKSDVFSYGVMLLELITGKRPVDNTNTMMEDSLVDWARPLMARALEDSNYDELVDSRLEDNFNPQEMARMVACAAASIRHSARRRPKMSQIVRALEGDVSLEDLNEITRPGQSSANSSNGSSDYDTRAYNADMQKFKKMALSSQEFSAEYGTTGELGSNSSGEMSNSGKPKPQY